MPAAIPDSVESTILPSVQCSIKVLAQFRNQDSSALNHKASAAHDLLLFRPDIEIAAHYIDMRRRTPLGARVRSIRVAECEMNTGNLLVLQNIAYDFTQRQICPDSQFAYPVAIFVAMRVVPEFLFELLVF